MRETVSQVGKNNQDTCQTRLYSFVHTTNSHDGKTVAFGIQLLKDSYTGLAHTKSFKHMYILPSIPLRNSMRMLQGWSNRYRNVKSSILRVTMNSTILRAVSVEVRQYIRLTSSSAIVLRSILHDNTTSLGVRLFFTHCQQCPLKVSAGKVPGEYGKNIQKDPITQWRPKKSSISASVQVFYIKVYIYWLYAIE